MSSPLALPAPSATDRIAALSCRDRMKRALALVADGMAYRDAAKEVGYGDHREVYRWAKQAGLLELHTEQQVASQRRIWGLSCAELEKRLVEHPEDIPTRDLAIIAGIAADKVAKYEGWGQRAPSSNGKAIVAMLAALHEVPARLEIAQPIAVVDVGQSKA